MSTLLVRHAAEVITMDHQRRRIRDGAVLVRDHVIEAVGPNGHPAGLGGPGH